MDAERRMEVIDSGDIYFRLYITVAEGTRKSIHYKERPLHNVASDDQP
ncbi:MAG: hypothetical protein OFPII_10060 [Osedax symbiont Rs1]|nr:MAG: hypothetical protein OFPII_41510 [Osedax symbiont Rs1]EPJ47594.1 MAG: hypothetical protein OFPII_10060 [Osedax symbiont Rs1]